MMVLLLLVLSVVNTPHQYNKGEVLENIASALNKKTSFMYESVEEIKRNDKKITSQFVRVAVNAYDKKGSHLKWEAKNPDDNPQDLPSQRRADNEIVFSSNKKIGCIDGVADKPLGLLIEKDSESNIGFSGITDCTLRETFGFCYFPDIGTVFIPDFCKDFSLSNFFSSIYNEQILCFSGEKDGYKIAVYVLPEKGYEICNISLQYISEYKKPGQIFYYNWEVQKFNKNINGQYYPQRIKKTSHIQGGEVDSGLPAGYTVQGKRTITIPDIYNENIIEVLLFDTIADSAQIGFSRDIPNYSKVYKTDVPQIKHVWLDGKVEPLTDELAISIAQGGHKFIPAPNESRFWMIAAGLIMIVIALAGKRRKYYKNKNNKGTQ